jgi:hypothetical protein
MAITRPLSGPAMFGKYGTKPPTRAPARRQRAAYLRAGTRAYAHDRRSTVNGAMEVRRGRRGRYADGG